MTVYGWYEQLAIGKDWESRIDKWARATFGIKVKEVSAEFDKAGIDRIWIKKGGIQTTVEYKADTMGHKTGNIFLETIANDTKKKMGWCYTSTSQFLLYLIIGSGQILWVPMSSVKDSVEKWIDGRDEKVVPNKDGYSSHGYAVPISEVVKTQGARVYWMNGTCN